MPNYEVGNHSAIKAINAKIMNQAINAKFMNQRNQHKIYESTESMESEVITQRE